MKLLIGLALLLSVVNVHAENLVCTLQSGVEKSSVVATFSELEDGYGEFFDEMGVQDLSYDMTLECQAGDCYADIIIYSQIREDEAGSTGFEFIRASSTEGRVFSDKITNTPDGKDYSLYCYYNL